MGISSTSSSTSSIPSSSSTVVVAVAVVVVVVLQQQQYCSSSSSFVVVVLQQQYCSSSSIVVVVLQQQYCSSSSSSIVVVVLEQQQQYCSGRKWHFLVFFLGKLAWQKRQVKLGLIFGIFVKNLLNFCLFLSFFQKPFFFLSKTLRLRQLCEKLGQIRSNFCNFGSHSGTFHKFLFKNSQKKPDFVNSRFFFLVKPWVFVSVAKSWVKLGLIFGILVRTVVHFTNFCSKTPRKSLILSILVFFLG